MDLRLFIWRSRPVAAGIFLEGLPRRWVACEPLQWTVRRLGKVLTSNAINFGFIRSGLCEVLRVFAMLQKILRFGTCTYIINII
jgi:hypothetical protein